MIGQQPFRIQPNMPVGDYVTYSVSASRDTAVVTACKDAGCLAWAHGWETVVDESTALGVNQAGYIRTLSRRTFTEGRTEAGLTVFRFEPYQRCFAEHRTRPDVFVKRDGDWRGNPTGRRRRHANARDWVEDFQENLGAIKTIQERG